MRALGVIAMAIAAFVPAAARAQPTDTNVPRADLARADVLFRVGQELRAAELYADACPKFAETQRLVPGIGVTLYLADCYEHLGHSAWAWTEFRKAERLARQRNDSRAGVAHARAAALEPKLKRVTIAVSKPAQQDGLEVALDGSPVPPERWNVALAADPGNHVLAVRLRGVDLRTIHVRIGAQSPPITVPVEEAQNAGVLPSMPTDPAAAGASPTPGAGPPSAAPANLPPSAALVAPTSSAPSDTPVVPAGAASPQPSGSFWSSIATRSTLELGLVGGGVAALGLGAGLLAVKDHALATNQQSGAGAASGVAFAVGAGAVVSAIVLYLTAPDDKASALVLSPVPMMGGGGGALLRGTF